MIITRSFPTEGEGKNGIAFSFSLSLMLMFVFKWVLSKQGELMIAIQLILSTVWVDKIVIKLSVCGILVRMIRKVIHISLPSLLLIRVAFQCFNAFCSLWTMLTS